MEYKESKRKRWVKRAAIVFLFLLILLTFFSNTIMNLSLPQVNVQKIETGIIKNQVRGSGVVISEEGYEVTADKTEIVQEIRKKAGDQVEQGETLFVVKTQQETDLEQMREELEQLELDYIKLVVESKISNEDKKKLEETGLSEAECMAQLEAAEEEKKEELRTDLLKKLDIVKQWKALGRKRQKLIEAEKADTPIEVVAPVAGTIQQINTVVGQNIETGSVIAVILQKQDTMTVSFPVTEEEAIKVKEGDAAAIISPVYLQNATAVLKSITAVPTEQQDASESMQEQTGKLLTFEVKGEFIGGENVTLAVELSQGNYDCVIPNSALQSDKEGKFVLVTRVKNSPLGNRYYVERVPVAVEASDDTSTAISGALYGDEYIVITSNLPLEGGGQVRVME